MKIPKARKLPSGSWFIQLRIGGTSVSITEDSEDMCVAKAMAIKTGIIKTRKRKDDITVAHAFDIYISGRSNILSPSTIRTYKHIRQFRFQGIMSMRVGALKKADIQSAINTEAKSIKPKTLKNAWGLFKAATYDYIDCDISRITLPEREPRNVTVYSGAELSKLFRAVEGDAIEVAVLLAAWLGLRRSEILALTYDCFNRERGTVAIKAARVPNENNELVEKGTKTAKSTRILTCPQIILEKIGEGDGYLYDGHKQNYIGSRLTRICELNNLPHISLHELRHTNASIMLSLNIPDKYAMERGGWSSNDTMKYIYQHTIDAGKSAADAAVNSFFETVYANKDANED